MARAEKSCRNLECKNGLTPGVIGIGRGKNGAPLIGSDGKISEIPKRWGWISCRACNPEEKAPYVPKSWTSEEITERARLADAKAPYVAPSAVASKLARIASATTPGSAPPPVNLQQHNELMTQISELNKKVTEMTEALSKSVSQNLDLSGTVGKLSAQVSELLAENARLRTAATAPISAPDPALDSPPPPKRRKSRQIAKQS